MVADGTILTPNGLEEGAVSPLKRGEKLDPSRLSVGLYMLFKTNPLPGLMGMSHTEEPHT